MILNHLLKHSRQPGFCGAWHRASVAVIAGVTFGGLIAGCGPEDPVAAVTEPPVVGVIEVAEQKVNPFFEFVGKTQAADTVALRARVTGFLEAMDFEEGGTVESGQVLFRIEPQQYEALVAEAEGQLAAAAASLNKAEVDLARYKDLLKSKSIPEMKVDEAQAEVLVQAAAVKQSEAMLAQASLNLSYTEITAPISGRIGLSALDIGNLVSPESGVLATINQMAPIQVAFAIAETWYLDLVRQDLTDRREGKRAGEFAHIPLLRMQDGEMYGHPGKFDFVDNKVDQRTGTVLIRALFPNPDALLLPGQFVTVVVERKEAKSAVLIPQSAVLTDQGGAYVLLVSGENKVEQRRIETGQRFGPNWQVNKGLKAGEHIVYSGIQKVRPGIQVKPERVEAALDPLQGSDSAVLEPVTAPADPGVGGDGPPAASADTAVKSD